MPPPKLQADREGERACAGILLGAFLGAILWTLAAMILWAYIN